MDAMYWSRSTSWNPALEEGLEQRVRSGDDHVDGAAPDRARLTAASARRHRVRVGPDDESVQHAQGRPAGALDRSRRPPAPRRR